MKRRCLSLLWLATLWAAPLAAECVVSGFVRYEDDTAVPGAAVELFQGEHLLETAWTDAEGWFAFELVPPAGDYQVITRQPGLEPTGTRLHLSENSPRAQLAIELREESAAALDDETKRLKFREELDALEESPFCSSDLMERDLESYRFLWLRSFHNPVLVVFTLDEVAPAVTYKEFDSPGRLTTERSDLAVTWNEATDASEGIVELGLEDFRGAFTDEFWSAPAYLVDESIPLDGARWIVEGRRAGHCHLAIRHSPDYTDPVRAIAEYLLFRLAGRDFPYTEVY